MPAYADNKCTKCGNITSPELLTVKQVNFSPRTQRKKISKSRVVAWLCEGCLANDPDFNLEPYKAPGMTSAPLERVRTGDVI